MPGIFTLTCCECRSFNVSKFFSCCDGQEQNVGNRRRAERMEEKRDVDALYMVDVLEDMDSVDPAYETKVSFNYGDLTREQKEFFTMHVFYMDSSNELRYLSTTDKFMPEGVLIENERITDVLPQKTFQLLKDVYKVTLRDKTSLCMVMSSSLAYLEDHDFYIQTHYMDTGFATLTIVPGSVVNCEEVKKSTLRKVRVKSTSLPRIDME